MILALIIVAAVLLLFAVIMINQLIGKQNQLKNALSGIDVQLKKRCDLVPNLVAGVSKYMEHEKSTLEELTQLRSQAVSGNASRSEKLELDQQIQTRIRSIMVQAESYPELKASENMLQLQRSLNEIEEQLSAARRAGNAAVTEFNNAVEMFPSCLFAAVLGYTRQDFFAVAEQERANPNVKELFKG